MAGRANADPPVALVTGGNRGIGLEVCRQLAHRGWTVVLGSRGEAKGETAAREIAGTRGQVLPCRLEVTDADSIEAARARVAGQLGRLDGLINNAAAVYDPGERAVDVDLTLVRDALETNTLGAWRMVQVSAAAPSERASPAGERLERGRLPGADGRRRGWPSGGRRRGERDLGRAAA